MHLLDIVHLIQRSKYLTLCFKRVKNQWRKGYTIFFQKRWTADVLPEVFKQDAKVMLPKPGKQIITQ